MKKSTKGAIAAGGAAVLLMGGAGTLAFWTSSQTVGGTSISTGHLSLDAGANACTGWTLDDNTAYDSSTQLLVPGDSLTQDCTYTLHMAGAHFKHVDFTVTTPSTITGSAALVSELTKSVTVKLNGVDQSSASNVAVHDGDTVAVHMGLTWDYGTENNASNAAGLGAALDKVVVGVQQDHG